MANYDSNSAVVTQTQKAINAAGYTPPLAVDGVYGPNTAAGVKWFQQLHGLSVDGIIGDQTVAATIAPPPAAADQAPPSGAAAADPIGNLSAQISQLVSVPVTQLSAPPAAAPRVVHLNLAGVGAAARANQAAAAMPLAVASPASSSTTGKVVGSLLGGVLGAVGGTLVRYPLYTAVGGVAGALVGLGIAIIAKK